MGRGGVHTRERLMIVLPAAALPAAVTAADDLWAAGRLLAQCWKAQSCEAWDAIGEASPIADAVLRLRPKTATHAGARYRWLLSLELEDALAGSIGPEPDEHPAHGMRMRRALSERIDAWQRLADGDRSPETEALEDAAEQVTALLVRWGRL